MRKQEVMGLLFSNMHDEAVRELTAGRAMGSVPFGGRYRLIDFTLSNWSMPGFPRMGVITKNNYQSLMDHLGSRQSLGFVPEKPGPVHPASLWLQRSAV